MCDDYVVYASDYVLRNKMTCTVKLDCSENGVCRVNLTVLTVQRARTQVKTSGSSDRSRLFLLM